MARRTSPKSKPTPRRVRRVASSTENGDPIKHVVVLALENRSFDQMLGAFKAIYSDMEGIDPAHPGENTSLSGEVYRQRPMTQTITLADPKHDHGAVIRQLEEGNSGFVRNYEESYPEMDRFPEEKHDKLRQIMGYFPLDVLPATHLLARHFTICDCWFSSVPGPTWVNRLFLLSGTSQGRVKMFEGLRELNLHPYTQDTIFDRLEEKKIQWRVYHGDFPLTLLFEHQRRWDARKGLRDLDEFERDAKGAEEDFPAFVFIEPDYIGPDAHDDHPPHDVMQGEWLIDMVYTALRHNEPLWNSTLFVLLFDEHGGFYDHVVPPKAVAPDTATDEYDFSQLGLRVPALLISPWVDRGFCSTVFDHTSLLRYLLDKWDLRPLGDRTSNANSLAPCIRTDGAPRTDTPDEIDVTVPPGTPTSARVRTDNELAILLLSQQLANRVQGDAGRIVRRIANAMANSPRVRDDVRRVLRAWVDGGEPS